MLGHTLLTIWLTTLEAGRVGMLLSFEGRTRGLEPPDGGTTNHCLNHLATLAIALPNIPSSKLVCVSINLMLRAINFYLFKSNLITNLRSQAYQLLAAPFKLWLQIDVLLFPIQIIFQHLHSSRRQFVSAYTNTVTSITLISHSEY